MDDDGDPAEAGDSDAVGASVTLHVRFSNGSKLTVETTLGSTVGALKAGLVEKCDIPAEQQRLIHKGRILKDDLTLESYGLQSDHTIHLVRGTPPTASSEATTVSHGASRAPNSTTGVERSGPNGGVQFGGADLGGSHFPGIGTDRRDGTGSGFLGFGFPELSQMQQQQLAQDPSMMREIMNMPAVQSLINNPDLLRGMIMNNPQMREVIDQNPDFAHILNDPGTLRQSLEVMRNPELMRELMRNTDRAMSNIESSPEGFNMLRRMYETVQEPFLNATTGAGNTGNDLGQNPFVALLGDQGTTQASDQTPSQSRSSSDATTETAAPNSNPLPNPWNRTAGGAQTTNQISAPASDGRSPAIAGLGGLGLPELERMAGGMPDPSVLNQLLQNPDIMQMMQNLLSNPQFMNQVLSPQLHGLLGSNSELRDMLQNPELVRQLTSPESLQQLLSFQQSFVYQIVRQQSSQEQNLTGGGGVAGTINNNGLEFLMNMIGGLGSGAGVPNNSDVPPEERFAAQLTQLQEMGFFDAQENIRALSATAGNVHAAVDWLLRNLDR